MHTKVVRSKYKQPSLCFFNTQTGCMQKEIWNDLENGLWHSFDVDAFLNNDTLSNVEMSSSRPIFPNLLAIPSGFRWDAKTSRIVETLYMPHYVNADYDSFLKVAEAFFRRYEGKKIGVHLSGGLDSSLIICLLHHFHIPFVPIGLYAHRFEFRTERHIQEILLDYGSDSKLISMDDYPFYSHLSEAPKSQIPNGNIKMCDAQKALADEFKALGVEVVFSGQGGDTILTESVPEPNRWHGFNLGYEFSVSEESEQIYSPRGIELVPFFADKNVIDQLQSLRVGQKEDALKLWARAFFKKLIPYELSEFSYTADFFGYSVSGLEEAKNEIKSLLAEAYETIRHPVFSPDGINKLLNADFSSMNYTQYCFTCSRLSIAVWLHSLFREYD